MGVEHQQREVSASARDNVRFVLVRTSKPGNLGAAARALANFGFGNLALVAPQCDPMDPAALRLSVRAEPFLKDAVRCDSLVEALADRQFVLATTARKEGTLRAGALAPWDAAMSDLAQAARTERVAIVFGPERTGLENDDLRHCHLLTSIPTSDRYPTLNLAQAATVVAYELSSRLTASEAVVEPAEEERASVADIDRSLSVLRGALERIGFLRHDKSGRLFDGLARVILRSAPTRNEVDIVTGLARQIDWALGRSINPPSP